MKLTRVESEDGPIVAASGEIDLESSPELRAALLAEVASDRTLGVDLSAVEYIDSSGIASLIETLQACKSSGGQLTLISPSDAVRKVIELARLDRVFEIVDRT